MKIDNSTRPQRQTGRYLSIRTRLFTAFVLVVLLSGVTITLISWVLDTQIDEQHAIERLQTAAALKHAVLDSLLANAQNSLVLLFTEPAMVDYAQMIVQSSTLALAPQEPVQHLRDDFSHFLIGQDRLFEEAYLMDSRGRIVLSTNYADEGKMETDATVLQQAAQDDFIYSIDLSATPPHEAIVLYHPLLDSKNQLIAYVVGVVRLSVLDQYMTDREGMGRTGQTYLVSKDYGPVTALRGEDLARSSTNKAGLVNTLGARLAITTQMDGAAQYQDYRQVPVVGVYHWLPRLNMALLSEQERTEVIESAEIFTGISAGFTFFIVLGAALIALLFIRSITRPLADLAGTASQIAAGNLDLDAPVHHNDEIGKLALAFNDMTARLRGTITNLQENMQALAQAKESIAHNEAYFRSLIENAYDVIVVANANGIIRYASPSVQRVFGFSVVEMIDQTVYDWAHPNDRAVFVRAVNTVLENPTQRASFELRFMRKNGTGGVIGGMVRNALADPAVQGLVINAREITERKRAEESLRESEQKFSALFEKAPFAATLSKLPDGILVDVNEAWVKLLGYTKQEAIGKTTLDLNINPDQQGRNRIFAQLQAQGWVRDQELNLRTKSGEWRHFSVNVDFVDIAGQKYLLNTAQDITERKRAQAQIQYQANLLNSVSDAIVASDENYILTTWNRAAEELYGWRADQVIGKEGIALLQTDFAGVDPAEMRRLIRETGHWRGEVTQSRQDGVRIPVEVASIVLHDETGHITGYVSVNRDITERKRIEAQLRQLSYAVEQSPASIVVTNTTGEIVYVNPKFTEITGYAFDEARGQNPRILKSGQTPPHVYEQLWNTITAGEEWRGEFLNKKKNGELYWESVSIAPILDSAGKITHYVAVKEDISERRKMEQELRDALEESRQRGSEIAALLQATRAILNHRQFDDAARAIFNACKNLVGAERGFVSRLSQNGTFNQMVFTDMGNVALAGESFPPMPVQGLTEQVIRSGETIYSNDVHENDLGILVPAGHMSIKNVMLAPLVVEGKTVGLIGLSGKRNGFTERNARMAKAFGELAAVALVNSQAEDELRRSHSELESRVAERTRELERLYAAEQQARQVAQVVCAANLSLTRTLNLNDVLHALLDYLVQLVPYDSANVMLLEGESRLVVRATRGYEQWTNPEAVRDIAFDVQTNPILYAMIANQQSVLIADTVNYPGWERPPGTEHVRSWLGVPLIAAGKVIGLYSMDKCIPGFFTPEHQSLAETLVAQAAVALQNAWLFEQVRAGHERFQNLSHRLVDVQEGERRYIARELHDEAGQALSSLIVGLRLLEKDADHPKSVVERVGELRRITDQVLENLHRLAMDLRPASLDYLGLEAALRQYIDTVREDGAGAVKFHSSGFDGVRLPAPVELTLYRIVQEGLSNALRHSHASLIKVQLLRNNEFVEASVEDNGVGFDYELALQSSRLGLVGMRERVEMIGGEIIFSSIPGQGTLMRVKVSNDNQNSNRG